MDEPLRIAPAPLLLPPWGVAALASRHAPGFSMTPERHDFDEIIFVEAGAGCLEREGRRILLAAADVVRIEAGEVHRFLDEQESPLTLLVLGVAKGFLAGPALATLWPEVLVRWPAERPLRFSTAYEAGEYRRVFRALILELGHERPGRDALIQAHALHLMVLLRRAAERSRPSEQGDGVGFAASLAALDDRLLEPLRISDLAELAGMSYRSYTEHFRRHKGVTVTQYVTQRRIEFAKRRMLETRSILGSALEAGFRDASHFYRVFKRTTGQTPQAFLQAGSAS